jgi:hypothetical protein
MKQQVDDDAVLLDRDAWLHAVLHRYVLRFRHVPTVIGMASDVSFEG